MSALSVQIVGLAESIFSFSLDTRSVENAEEVSVSMSVQDLCDKPFFSATFFRLAAKPII
ncbi:MAG TPA: hypothetical protein PLX08_09885 [Bacteroidales bacterium]|jgi:hypothetical protein|nr:hypothetical protein [Bacteroidales bacterium]